MDLLKIYFTSLMHSTGRIMCQVSAHSGFHQLTQKQPTQDVYKQDDILYIYPNEF